jgi:hypothetical protein
MLQRAERIVMETPKGVVEIRRGRVVLADDLLDSGPDSSADGDGPPERERADEMFVIARWLSAHAHRVRLLHVDGELASSLPRVPDYTG